MTQAIEFIVKYLPILALGRQLLNVFLAAALMLAFFLNLPLWLDAYNGVTNTPTIYASLIIVGLLVAVCNFSLATQYITTSFAKWCTAVLIVYSISYVRLLVLEYPSDDLISSLDRVQFFLLAPIIGFIVFQIKHEILFPYVKFLAILTPLLVISDFFFPDLMHSGLEEDIVRLTEKSRVSGTWFNANAAGEAIVLSLVLARNLFSRVALALVFSLAGLALIFTGSRSGIAILGVLGVYLILQRRLPIAYLILPILLVVFFGEFLERVEDAASYFNRDSGIADTLNRLEYFSGDGVQDESSYVRSEIVRVSFTDSLDNPLFGHGVNFIDQVWLVGPHNMIAALAYAFGLFGLALWLGLVYVLYSSRTHQRWNNPELMVFIWYSFFSHNIMETNFWFIFWAIAVFCNGSIIARTSSSSRSPLKLFSFNKNKRSGSGRRKKRRQLMRW